LRITLGSKFEHNGFTGFEVQPNARLLWTITRNQTVWTAVSRAARTPALTEEGLRLNSAVVPPGTPQNPTPFPALISVFGSHQFKSEDLLAYEAGYRVQVTSNFSADIAAFYNHYTHLRTAEPGTPFLEVTPAPVHLVVPFVAGNKMSGGTYGTELFADWRVLPKWRLLSSYSYLLMEIRKDPSSLDPTADDPGLVSPRHQFYVRSSIDLPKHFEHDFDVRYTDRLPGLNIPSYYSLDTHLGWRPRTGLELSVGSQNLLDKRHLEFVPDFITTSPTEVKRTFYGSVTWRFE
jgi:iron complex outermembrane receptor protein